LQRPKNGKQTQTDILGRTWQATSLQEIIDYQYRMTKRALPKAVLTGGLSNNTMPLCLLDNVKGASE